MNRRAILNGQNIFRRETIGNKKNILSREAVFNRKTPGNPKTPWKRRIFLDTEIIPKRRIFLDMEIAPKWKTILPVSSPKGLRILLLLVLCLCLLPLNGCQAKEPITRTSFHLNTAVTITIYDSQDTNLLDECMRLCEAYEDIFSRTGEESQLTQLNIQAALPENVGQPLPLSQDLASLTETGLYYSQLSQGAFDLTIAPLSSLWDFTAEEPSVPDEAVLKSALPLVDYQQISLSSSGSQSYITFSKPGMGLDLGAIAKGYIADRLKDYLLSQGVKSALINLGGNILCVGEKPDGSPFTVGIQRPFANQNETIATLDIRDLSVVSSGVYERCFWQEGTFYHHLLDPKTGYPYHSRLVSVTIISENSVDGDGLSTACFALGLEEGLALLNNLEGVHGIFITEDSQIYYTEGFSEAFPIKETP